MIDKYNDNYAQPNYRRLFLLFILFLSSLYFRLWWAAEEYVSASEKSVEYTTIECIMVWLDSNCDMKHAEK